MGFGRIVAGEDGTGRTALPAGEMLHLAPLAAVLVLAVNDHILKGSGLVPGWLTGKLSDVAGVFFFPLLATATLDTIALGVARLSGARLDFSLRRWKLAAALAVTAAAFTALELSEAFGAAWVATLGRIGFPSTTTRDPTDLVALVMLVPAWLVGRAELARVPLGRLEVMRRAGRVDLADVRALARETAAVDALAEALEAWLAAPTEASAARVEARLAALRGGPPPGP
jgi:hypothetical protein